MTNVNEVILYCKEPEPVFLEKDKNYMIATCIKINYSPQFKYSTNDIIIINLISNCNCELQPGDPIGVINFN